MRLDKYYVFAASAEARTDEEIFFTDGYTYMDRITTGSFLRYEDYIGSGMLYVGDLDDELHYGLISLKQTELPNTYHILSVLSRTTMALLVPTTSNISNQGIICQPQRVRSGL